MPRYRVTLRRTTIEIVEAANPYQAAIVARDLGGGDVEVSSVAPAVGRPAATSVTRKAIKSAEKPTKKVAKKRKPLSPEARAKLAQNLVKARAARAAKRDGTTKKSPAKKEKRVSKRR
jgi:hypothetical protein